jgi:hypothetical protein
MSTVRVSLNRWGNYDCFIGINRTEKYGDEFSAKTWLAARVLEGHTVSDKSDFTADQVEAYKSYVDKKSLGSAWSHNDNQTIILSTPRAYDVWKNRRGNYKAELAKKEIVDDRDAPYGFDIHEIRVLARDGNDAIRKAKKA